ncbi:MAG: P-loop ATPase, Sll1717 family [Prochlorococcaceae cyanobacterium]|jgi:hypothetical protein
MKKDLINPALFGNDAGEDEQPDVLNSYFLEKDIFAPFFDIKTRLSLVRSRKGMGKSALLSELAYRRQIQDPEEVVIYVKASDLVSLQEIEASSANSLINGWQQRLCSRINLELGSILQIAFSDDAIKLVEKSELSGFRGRNLVGSLVDRLRIKIAGAEAGRATVQIGNEQALLQKYSENSSRTVWLLVDDVDATFLNSNEERLATSTFFSACRNLVGTVSGLNIRASVRSDVWTILAQYDEALDKCEQYMIDIRWSTRETGLILKNKITSYFERTYGAIPPYASQSIFGTIFREPMTWDGHPLEPFRLIHILCNGRPRWATKLCRVAGRHANQANQDLITKRHIDNSLREYGQARLSDLYKEHRHQCQQIVLLVEAFAGGKKELTTAEVLSVIDERIVALHGLPTIDGNDGVDGSMRVAHFLYRIGFFNARDDRGASLEFIAFEDRPNLLCTVANPDDGLNWEIHPSYRATLRIGPSRSARGGG